MGGVLCYTVLLYYTSICMLDNGHVCVTNVLMLDGDTMLHENPFYPSFSLRPELFYGRADYLKHYEAALENQNSPRISFMLTGARGCGKTSLLHQFAICARRAHMDVIEASSVDALARVREYAGMQGGMLKKRSLSPTLTLSGVGSASLGEVSTTSTRDAKDNPPDALLAEYLCKKLSGFGMREGLALLIDEAQKLTDSDLVLLGNAVQQAVTNGHRVGLVLGGLPSSYHKVRSVKSCTFLHRMERVNLWCMDVEETLGFLRMMFARVPELQLTDDALFQLGRFSGGHPYLMQLLGDAVYRVADRTSMSDKVARISVTEAMIREAEEIALNSYQDNVLANVLSGVRSTTREYIRIAYELRDAEGLVSTRDVAERLGMTTREANPIRSYALSTQVLQREERGYVSFALPHCRYIFEPFEHRERQKPRSERWQY